MKKLGLISGLMLTAIAMLIWAEGDPEYGVNGYTKKGGVLTGNLSTTQICVSRGGPSETAVSDPVTAWYEIVLVNGQTYDVYSWKYFGDSLFASDTTRITVDFDWQQVDLNLTYQSP